MNFYEILDQVLALLRSRGRVTYGALKRQFNLDDAFLDDLKAEVIKGQRLAVDEDGEVLVWSGGATLSPPSETMAKQEQSLSPLTYTPSYLAEQIRTVRPSLEGERKQVTVLFADLKSSTELIQGLDPEAAQQLLDPVIHRMMDAVHRFEGTVNQVLGDGIMALFGAPLAQEDHALRACYAALAMQAALRAYTEEVRHRQGIELHMRVGLNSGEVVVRAIGNDLHMDYSAVGETTHLAARMEQLATPGTIRLTAATLRLVEGLVRINALGAVPVKGVAEPVDVFELIGVTGLRRRLQATVARGLTRFVGRQTELEMLRQTLTQVDAGHGQLVALVGEAGVGKSRLVYEFVHSHHTRGWLVLESASVSYGKATPYFPVLDLLRRYCHLDDTDDTRTVRAKVTGQILTLDAALQDAIPALLALLDVLPEDSPFRQLDPPQRRQRTLEALRRVLLWESQVQPLLLVFEDLHWIDAETQALLDRLVETLPSARVLLLVNYHPEYRHGWGSKTYYTQFRLDPLPPASAETVLDALLGDGGGAQPAAPLQALKQLLIARTEGNPFFLEESVRTLVESGILVGERGDYRLTQELPTIQVPATVHAVLAAHLDRLPAQEKRLLQTAAVIGTEVPLPLLQAIAELPEDALQRGLAHLQAAEFVYETRLFPERVSTFKHALTHEVAYGSLLQERRRGLHARIVEALEALHADRLTEQTERLAHHALRSEVWQKALAYSRQAGDRAFARSAYQEAAGYFEQALAALQHLPESRQTHEQAIDLHYDLRLAYLPLLELPRVIEHLQAAESLAETLGDQRRLGSILASMTQYLSQRGEHDRALVAGQRAVALADALGDFALQVESNCFLGTIYRALGDHRRAIECYGRSLAAIPGERLYERFALGGVPAVQCRALLVWSLVKQGGFVAGRTYIDGALRIAEQVAHTITLLHAYFGAGFLALHQGDLPTAILRLERGLEICQSQQALAFFSRFASTLGAAYALSGRLAEALPLLEQAVEQSVSRGYLMGYAAWLVHLGEAHLLAGSIEAATRCAERAQAYAQAHQERGHEAWALRLLGDIAAHRDTAAAEPAAKCYRQALALADELGMRPLQAHCHLGLGTLRAKTGQRQQARAELSAAITLYRAMDMTFWLPQAEATLAQVGGTDVSAGDSGSYNARAAENG